MSITTVTLNPSVDKSTSAEYVAPEVKIRCTPPRWEAGGGGINVARAITDDSMVAGITLALARGEELENAVRYGVAAGAAAVMTEGSELCCREDVERTYEMRG